MWRRRMPARGPGARGRLRPYAATDRSGGWNRPPPATNLGKNLSCLPVWLARCIGRRFAKALLTDVASRPSPNKVPSPGWRLEQRRLLNHFLEVKNAG